MQSRNTKREIEAKIKSAFYSASDDADIKILRSAILSLSDAPSIGKDSVRDMTTRRNHTSLFKYLAIAAAIIAVLSITVTATSLSGLESKDDAIRAAVSYMVNNEKDEALRDALSFAALTGEVSLDEITESTAKLGLSDGRLVYNVSFYAAGYKCSCTVDAKSLVVLDGSKSYEPDYVPKNETIAKKSSNKDAAQKKPSVQHKVTQRDAERIFIENFGLYHSLIVNTSDRGDMENVITETDDGKYCVTRRCDGYFYSCNIDWDTGELTNANVTALENYEGEAVLHEKIEGLIGIERADQLALELTNAEKILFSADLFKDDKGEYFYIVQTVISDERHSSVSINAKTGELISKTAEYLPIEMASKLAFEAAGIDTEQYHFVGGSKGDTVYAYMDKNISGVDEYQFEITDESAGARYDVIIDMYSGEVLSVKSYDIDFKGEKEESSDENVEGAIGKSAATAIALENSGMTIKDSTNGAPKAALSKADGKSVYTVKWQSVLGGQIIDFECLVDAISGEVVSSAPLIIRPDIEAESAKGSYIGKKAAEEALIKDLMIDKDSMVIISSEIEKYCLKASNEQVEFIAAYAISFDRRRVDAAYEVAYVDAITGEVLGYKTWSSGN